jgi:uracil-DNA glycosylase family 4
MTNELADLYDEISSCPLCKKYINSLMPRPGFPIGEYDIMFIGAEPGPGAVDRPTPEEYKERFMPWTKNRNTIRLLFIDIQNAGVNIERVYYTNSVKCPCKPKEAKVLYEKCKSHLHRQIQLIKPKALVVIGSAAVKMGLPVATQNQYIDTSYNGIRTFIIRHPQGATIDYRTKVARKIKGIFDE